jgi:signal transduction histidine kinase
MTSSHAAWEHLIGTGVALEDIAADTALPKAMREQLQAIHDKAEVSEVLTRADMAEIGACLIHLGQKAGSWSQNP